MIQQLDALFEGKSKKDILYMHLAAISLIGFIVFYFIYPMADKYSSQEEQQFQDHSTKLNTLNIKKNADIAQIARLTRDKKKMLAKKNSLYKQKIFFNDLISLLDFAKFDKYKWANYVQNIVYNAKDEGLKLIKFENYLYDDNNTTINKKMDVVINANGKFKNFITYIYKYENTKQLIRINELEVSDKGEYMIKFTLYGYKE